MDERLLAYLAGVLDSDGSITIIRHKPNQKYPDSFTYSELVQVAQTSDEAVGLFAELWPGTSVLRKRNKNWRAMYEWRVSNKKAAECVALLRPYLRVKAMQADLILALRESKSLPWAETRTQRVGVRSCRLDPSVVAMRTDLWYQVRSLNDRRVRNYGPPRS